MDLFLNCMIFIMGTFFGSFFTLAVYRIPLGKDITHEHSFCPNCNHKLGILDLIPIFSYLFLKGKCRYCKQKVRIRYLALEVLSGIVFLVAYQSFHIQNIIFELPKMIDFVFFVMLYVTLVIIAGIDKEYRKINSSVLLFGAVCQMLYILYLYIIEDASRYRYSIYFAIFVLLFIINTILQKRKENYFFQVFTLCFYVQAILGIKATIIILLFSMISRSIYYALKKEKYRKVSDVPVGFFIAVVTVTYTIAKNFVEFYNR